MSFDSLPLVLFMLLPGFITWSIFSWGTVERRISQIERLFTSLILSVVSFGLAYLLIDVIKRGVAAVAQADWALESLPGFIAILGDPTTLPPEVGIVTYVLAVIMGLVLARLYKADAFRRLGLRVGLDLYAFEDPWHLAFRRQSWITVYLIDGTVVSGWPTYISHRGGANDAQVYLSKIAYSQDEKWVEQPASVDGVLIMASAIASVEYWDPEQASGETAEADMATVPDVPGAASYLRAGLLMFSLGLVLNRLETWGTVSVNLGLSLAIFSLVVFAPGVLSQRVRAKLATISERIKNRRLRRVPAMIEWYLVVGLLFVGIVDGIVTLVNRETPDILIVVLFGVFLGWLGVMAAELLLRAFRSH